MANKSIVKTDSITLFVIITLLLSAVCWWLISVRGPTSWNLTSLMWCPGVAAILLWHKWNPAKDLFGWPIARTQYLVEGLALPIIYLTIAYAIYRKQLPVMYINGHSPLWLYNNKISSYFPNSLIILIQILSIGALRIGIWLFSALGEEIGWRGYLLPILSRRFGFGLGSILVGIIWATWHIPLLFITNSPHLKSFSILGTSSFYLITIGLSFPLGWLRLRSKSVWPCALLHASHDAFMLPIENVLFQIILGILLVLVALFYLIRSRPGAANHGPGLPMRSTPDPSR
jgi:uncharacterized protein